MFKRCSEHRDLMPRQELLHVRSRALVEDRKTVHRCCELLPRPLSVGYPAGWLCTIRVITICHNREGDSGHAKGLRGIVCWEIGLG